MILYMVGMWYIFYVDCDVLLDVVDIDFEGFGVKVIGDVFDVCLSIVVLVWFWGFDVIYIYKGI